MKEKKNVTAKWNSKRIVALIGVILLAAVYIGTLLIAIFAPQHSDMALRFCIFGTVAIPVLIWIYIWMYGKLSGRHTIADPDYLQDIVPEESAQEEKTEE